MRGEETLKKFLPHVLAKFRVRSVYFCTGREEVLSKNERRAKKKEKNKLGGNRPKFPDIPPLPDDFKNSPERRSSIFHPRSGKTKRRRQSCTTGSRERFLIRLRAVGQHAKHPSNFERPSANKISAACFSIFSHLFPTTTMFPCTRINDSEIGPLSKYAVVARGNEEGRGPDSLPYFLLHSSCRLPAASDISQTATILARATPTVGGKCIQSCMVCVSRRGIVESRKIGDSILVVGTIFRPTKTIETTKRESA